MTSERIELAGGWFFRKLLVFGGWALNTPDCEISGWSFSDKEARAFAAALQQSQPQAPASGEWQPVDEDAETGLAALLTFIDSFDTRHDLFPSAIVKVEHGGFLSGLMLGHLRGARRAIKTILAAAPTPDQGRDER